MYKPVWLIPPISVFIEVGNVEVTTALGSCFFGLLSVFLNDIEKDFNFNSVLYADDINLHISGKNYKNLFTMNLEEWSNAS